MPYLTKPSLPVKVLRVAPVPLISIGGFKYTVLGPAAMFAISVPEQQVAGPSYFRRSLSHLAAVPSLREKARSAIAIAGSLVLSTSRPIVGTSPTSRTEKQSWEDWMKDWRLSRRGSTKGTTTVHLLPGWAVRQPYAYRDGRGDAGGLATFIEVS